MSRLASLAAGLSVFVTAASGVAQESPSEVLGQPGADLTDPAFRARAAGRIRVFEENRRQNARARASLMGLPLRVERPNGRIEEIADFDLEGRPLYLATQNANAAISTGANLLRVSPYSLSGSGVVVGVWDGGAVRSSHQEFGSRVTVRDGAASIDHATHVGGTIAATGVVASARGMANAATIDSYDWNSDNAEMIAVGASAPGQAGKIYLSNHSYGYISGWNYVNGGSPARVWEWNGNGTTNTGFDQDFGRYNTYARDMDSLAYGASYYLIFRSAGNDRTDNPSSGQAVALSPGSTTVVSYDPAGHPAGDGNYRGGFETIGFNALAKNVITVGSVTDAVTSGSRNPSAVATSSFSSWGPTDDGRIKPDVVANGEALYSSLNGSNTSYGTYSGTSMATPNAAGSAALLIQQYSGLFPGQAMRSSTLKALLIHTADDLGNTGPDYKFGWGLINVKAAADLLADHQAAPDKLRLNENQLTTSTTSRAVSFVWDGVSPITATLCWNDPAGAATTTSDSRTPRLVNNLNLKLIAPGGAEYQPYVMPFVGTWTQASMDLPATTGVNATDNVEQVRIAAPPAAGTYQAVVSFSGTLTNSSQHYSLILSGSSAEPPPPPPLVLSGVSPASGLSSGPATLTLGGTGLRADTMVKLTRSGEPDITATNVQLAGETLTCQVNLTGAGAGAWSVTATNPEPNPGSSTLADAFTVIGAIWAENFDGTVSGWTSDATTGTNSWSLVSSAYHSASNSYFCPGPSTKTTTNLISPSVFIPAGATNLQLKFWHKYTLQNLRDGGRLEFSVDDGAWFDVLASGSGTSFASNGYNTTLNTKTKPTAAGDFAGQAAWSGNSSTFIETIVNFTDTAKFAGNNLRMRWRLATDAGTASAGWHVDSISLIGGGDLSNQAPAITTGPDTASSETQTEGDGTVFEIVRAATVGLSVAATDDAGEENLTYAWSVASGPAVPVAFSVNGHNSAKNTEAEFGAPGDYQIRVTVTDAFGLSSTGTVHVRVLQSASGLLVEPVNTSVVVGSERAFGATLIDQFSDPMNPQPASFDWSVSGGGSISPEGLFTATTAGGPYVVIAASGSFSNTAAVTVTPAPATVTLSNLAQTYDGAPKPVTATTDPPGLTISITYDGSPDAPVDAGSYAVSAVITDPNYQGSASGTLVIEAADDFASWQDEEFTEIERNAGLSVPGADPDADGLANLAEYALGADPHVFTPAPAAVKDENGLTLTFTRPAGLPDVTYHAESSDGLGSWTPVPLEVISTAGETETVQARDPLTSGDSAKRFMRLRFTRP